MSAFSCWKFIIYSIINACVGLIWVYSWWPFCYENKDFFPVCICYIGIILDRGKHPGQPWPGKGSIGAKLHSGSTMTRKSVKLTNNGVRLTQLWVIFRVKLTDFRVIVDPEWSLAPMDSFPGHADPGVFRVGEFSTLMFFCLHFCVNVIMISIIEWSILSMIFSYYPIYNVCLCSKIKMCEKIYRPEIK